MADGCGAQARPKPCWELVAGSPVHPDEVDGDGGAHNTEAVCDHQHEQHLGGRAGVGCGMRSQHTTSQQTALWRCQVAARQKDVCTLQGSLLTTPPPALAITMDGTMKAIRR